MRVVSCWVWSSRSRTVLVWRPVVSGTAYSAYMRWSPPGVRGARRITLVRATTSICTNAGVPSCMRVPPETGRPVTGRRSSIARSNAREILRAAAMPVVPARKPNSLATNAHGLPSIVARPVHPDRFLAPRGWRRIAGVGRRAGSDVPSLAGLRVVAYRVHVQIRVRFYAELVDLAGDAEVEVPFGRSRSVKDLIEAIGVPHPEIALIVVDGEPVDFDHLVTGGESVAVYPPLHSLDLSGVTTVAPAPVPPRFVLDVHLGTLARRLRLLGFDCWYRTDVDDAQLADVAVTERRILLTRDRGLLMRRVITHGYCPRSNDPDRQALEVVRRFRLADRLAPMTRCVHCNGRLRPVTKADVLDRLPVRTRSEFDDFVRCERCAQVYWPGSHIDATDDFLARAAAVGGRARTPAAARGASADLP
jgi:uncharacterized protein